MTKAHKLKRAAELRNEAADLHKQAMGELVNRDRQQELGHTLGIHRFDTFSVGFYNGNIRLIYTPVDEDQSETDPFQWEVVVPPGIYNRGVSSMIVAAQNGKIKVRKESV